MSRLAKWSSLSIIFVIFLLLTVFVRLFTLRDETTKKMILEDTDEGEENWKYLTRSGYKPASVTVTASD